MQIHIDLRPRGKSSRLITKELSPRPPSPSWYSADVDNIPIILLLYCHALSGGKSPPSHRGMYRRSNKRRKSIGEAMSKSTGLTRCGYTGTFEIEREETEDRLTKHYQNRQRTHTMRCR